MGALNAERTAEGLDGLRQWRLRRSLALVAGGAAASLPLAGSALAAPAVCACGGGGSSAPPAPAPEEEIARDTAPEQAESPAPPPPSPPAPPPSVPRTPDAAERWLENEPDPPPPPRPTRQAPTPEDEVAVEDAPEEEPEPPAEPPEVTAADEPPAPAPRRQIHGVDAELYRRLGPEDQQAIRESHERRSEPAAEAEPEPEPEPEPPATEADVTEPPPVARPPAHGPAPPSASLPRMSDAAEAWLNRREQPDQPEEDAEEPPAPDPGEAGPKRYGVDADLYNRLGPEDQQAIRDEWEGEPSPPQYTPCSPVEPFHEDVCVEHPPAVHHGDKPVLCVPGEGPRDSSCRGVTVDEAENPAEAGAIWCHPLQGPYIGTRPCAPGEAPPPQGPVIQQGAEPSDDYESWRDPARRGRERYQRFDEALPTTREWEIEDFQQRDAGRLRVGLFIATEDSGIGPVRGEGDNRTFDSQFSPYATRAYIEVDFETDRAFVVANPTCDPGGGCNDAKHIGDGALGDYSNEVTLEEQDDGDIYIQYELANARLPGPLSGASIDGHLTVRPNEDGTFEVRWFGDRYPSWEAYYDDACGNVWIITQDEEGEITDLLPWVSDRHRVVTVPVARQEDC